MGKVSINDLTQARFLLEPEVFRLAVGNASEAQMAEMAAVVREDKKLKDLKKQNGLHSDFHRSVAMASGSPICLRFMQIIFDFMEAFAMTIQPANFRVHDDRDHSEILEALSHRDGDRAARLAKAHAEKVTREMIKLERQWRKALEDLNGPTRRSWMK